MNVIQKYFRYRQNLIDQYVRGDMSKTEYLESNYNAVLSLHIQPFKNIDSVEKGLFNYQYYNAMAKEAKIVSSDYSDYELRKQQLEESNYNYRRKDDSTLAVLRLLEFKNVHAYYIKVRSKYLKGKLVEIVLEDYNMILHTTNSYILQKLTEEGIFSSNTKESLIDGYINQKY